VRPGRTICVAHIFVCGEETIHAVLKNGFAKHRNKLKVPRQAAAHEAMKDGEGSAVRSVVLEPGQGRGSISATNSLAAFIADVDLTPAVPS
jgi:hypothetical protein